MGEYMMQGYGQWGLWGEQAPADYQQGQAPWHGQQPGYGWQGQQPWYPQQPQQPWNARQSWEVQQQSISSQDVWNGYGQNGAGQDWPYARTQWPDDLESLIAEPEAVPETVAETEQTEAKQPSKAVNLVLNILTFGFVLFLLAGSTMFAFSNKDTKSLFGYRFYNVLTPSMAPFFKPGDMIFVKLVKDPLTDVQPGDVVTFKPSPKSDAFLTHRVVELLPEEEKRPPRMVTKGDHNNAEDPPVALSAVVGVHQFTIPFFGKVVDLMRANLIVVCVCIGAVFLLLTVLRAYFAARREEKQKAAAPPTRDIHAF